MTSATNSTLDHLAAKGALVARAVRRKDGGRITTIAAPECDRLAVLFAYAPGRELKMDDSDSADFGRSCATISPANTGDSNWIWFTCSTSRSPSFVRICNTVRRIGIFCKPWQIDYGNAWALWIDRLSIAVFATAISTAETCIVKRIASLILISTAAVRVVARMTLPFIGGYRD
jgi:hypothetical protein